MAVWKGELQGFRWYLGSDVPVGRSGPGPSNGGSSSAWLDITSTGSWMCGAVRAGDGRQTSGARTSRPRRRVARTLLPRGGRREQPEKDTCLRSACVCYSRATATGLRCCLKAHPVPATPWRTGRLRVLDVIGAARVGAAFASCGASTARRRPGPPGSADPLSITKRASPQHADLRSYSGTPEPSAIGPREDSLPTTCPLRPLGAAHRPNMSARSLSVSRSCCSRPSPN